MPLSDQEILERFGRRFAAIERQIPATGPFEVTRHRRGVARIWGLPAVAAAVVLLVAVGGPLLAGRSAVSGPSPLGSPTPVAATPAPTGLSELNLTVVVEPPPLPSGIVTSGMVPYSHYAARLETPDGNIVTVWAPIPGDRFPSVVLVEAGSYRLSVWRYNLVDNVDTGVRSSTPPAGLCSTTVSVAPSDPTRLVATFAYGGVQPCSFTTGAGTSASTSPTAISPAAAAALGRQHVSPDAQLLAIASGYFAELNTQSGTGPGYPIQPSNLVWAVRFSSTMVICPPAAPGPTDQPSCWPARPGTIVVFLNYATGDFLATQASAPAS